MTGKLRNMVEVTLTTTDLAGVLTEQLCGSFTLLSELEVSNIIHDAGNFRLVLLPKRKPMRAVDKVNLG